MKLYRAWNTKREAEKRCSALNDERSIIASRTRKKIFGQVFVLKKLQRWFPPFLVPPCKGLRNIASRARSVIRFSRGARSRKGNRFLSHLGGEINAVVIVRCVDGNVIIFTSNQVQSPSPVTAFERRIRRQ